MEIRAAVGPARQVFAPVDVQGRQRGLERQVERASPDRGRAVEKLQRGEPLLDHGRGVEGLAPLEAQVDRVGAEVLRQEAARTDLARRVEREAPLEVLEELLVGVVADREHAPETPGQVVGHVIEPELPAGFRLERVGAERAVRQGAEPVGGVGRRLRERHAHRRLLVADHVALKEPRRLVRRPPARLLAQPRRCRRRRRRPAWSCPSSGPSPSSTTARGSRRAGCCSRSPASEGPRRGPASSARSGTACRGAAPDRRATPRSSSGRSRRA